MSAHYDVDATQRSRDMAAILLIDDDDDVRTATALMLERAGHEVTTLPNGRDALARCRETSFDVVITDLVMPEQEGIETIRTLRSENPDLSIIAISGGGGYASGSEYLRTARMLGADATFEKPVPPDRLQTAVEDLLDT
jgi:CheY-like chemotaxis protein